ncbi:TPA: hypothetical protein MDY34_005877, partial [Klebsiella pneumoniae]|nr:hypothetical protein [Klebsiella pneumoniae]
MNVCCIAVFAMSNLLMVALHRHRLSHPHLLLTRQNQKAISHSMALKVTSLRTISPLMVISQQTSLM